MKFDTVQRHALALEAVSAAPHHNYASFRARGKIFVTVPPGEEYIHVFVGEVDREPALAMYPEFIEKLSWGGKVVGLRIRLAGAQAGVVKTLVAKACAARVGKDAGAKIRSS